MRSILFALGSLGLIGCEPAVNAPLDGGRVFDAGGHVDAEVFDAGRHLDVEVVDAGEDSSAPVDSGAIDAQHASDAAGASDTGNRGGGSGGPSCEAEVDCAAVGADLACSGGRCITGGQCALDSDCEVTESCVLGTCRPRASGCDFDRDCAGPGQRCVDARCLVECSDGSCSAGLECRAGFCEEVRSDCECPTTEVCSPLGCRTPCSTDRRCESGFLCDHGGCRLDDRPSDSCPATPCRPGSLCLDGTCRLPCVDDTTCAMADSRIPLCRADSASGMMICFGENEVFPECRRSSECRSGERCIDATCVPSPES